MKNNRAISEELKTEKPDRPPHIPVMLNEVLAWVPPQASVCFDLTAGAGGHTRALLQRFPDTKIYACDRDPESIERLKCLPEDRAELYHGNFDDFLADMSARGIRADFILADLGVSSMQLDTPARGFSFISDAFPDMRMNPKDRLTATEIVNTYSREALMKLFYEFGEETYAAKIASAIEQKRRGTPFSSTRALADTIASVKPFNRHERIHPATKTFMALRIEVNRETNILAKMLAKLPDALNTGGVAAVISFHSLEDRAVKHRFRELCRHCICPPQQPVCQCPGKASFKLLSAKALLPSVEECGQNPRARSAKLRGIEKLI